MTCAQRVQLEERRINIRFLICKTYTVPHTYLRLCNEWVPLSGLQRNDQMLSWLYGVRGHLIPWYIDGFEYQPKRQKARCGVT